MDGTRLDREACRLLTCLSRKAHHEDHPANLEGEDVMARGTRNLHLQLWLPPARGMSIEGDQESDGLPTPSLKPVSEGGACPRIRRQSVMLAVLLVDSPPCRGYHSITTSFQNKVFHLEKRWKLVRELGSGAYGVVMYVHPFSFVIRKPLKGIQLCRGRDFKRDRRYQASNSRL